MAEPCWHGGCGIQVDLTCPLSTDSYCSTFKTKQNKQTNNNWKIPASCAWSYWAGTICNTMCHELVFIILAGSISLAPQQAYRMHLGSWTLREMVLLHFPGPCLLFHCPISILLPSSYPPPPRMSLLVWLAYNLASWLCWRRGSGSFLLIPMGNSHLPEVTSWLIPLTEMTASGRLLLFLSSTIPLMPWCTCRKNLTVELWS